MFASRHFRMGTPIPSRRSVIGIPVGLSGERRDSRCSSRAVPNPDGDVPNPKLEVRSQKFEVDDLRRIFRLQVPRKLKDVTMRTVVAATIAAGLSWSCGSSWPTAPTAYHAVTRESAADALEYWKSILGVDYEFVDDVSPPVLAIYPSGVPAGHLGFSIVDEAANGLITRSSVGILSTLQCQRDVELCHYVYRHSLGHILGFFGHSTSGLMTGDGATATTVLAPADELMMRALYSMPPGSSLTTDGAWRNEMLNLSGQLQEPSAVSGVFQYNIDIASTIVQGKNSCSLESGVTCRVGEHLRVLLRQQTP